MLTSDGFNGFTSRGGGVISASARTRPSRCPSLGARARQRLTAKRGGDPSGRASTVPTFADVSANAAAALSRLAGIRRPAADGRLPRGGRRHRGRHSSDADARRGTARRPDGPRARLRRRGEPLGRRANLAAAARRREKRPVDADAGDGIRTEAEASGEANAVSPQLVDAPRTVAGAGRRTRAPDAGGPPPVRADRVLRGVRALRRPGPCGAGGAGSGMGRNATDGRCREVQMSERDERKESSRNRLGSRAARSLTRRSPSCSGPAGPSRRRRWGRWPVGTSTSKTKGAL